MCVNAHFQALLVLLFTAIELSVLIFCDDRVKGLDQLGHRSSLVLLLQFCGDSVVFHQVEVTWKIQIMLNTNFAQL